MFGIASKIFKPLQLVKQILTTTSNGGLHTASSVVAKPDLLCPQPVIFTSIRTKVRCYFPRPNEVKRARGQGYEKRMSTPGGKKVIMRRILKGRYVLSH